ncbi:MAG: histidine phosphatase family protein [Actinobacteria bacterium]|nr:histidine phosphatase family protein [Actinomycetota bacterium]
MKVFLVRHARAGHRNEWEGDDHDRPLSRRGLEQSKRLIRQLEGYKIDRVLSSPYLRCVQTVELLAGVRDLKVEESDDFAEGNGHKAIEVVRGLAEGSHNVVACSHGDVIPDVVDHLLRTDAINLPTVQGWAKGSTWVLTAHGGRFESALYLPPPE